MSELKHDHTPNTAATTEMKTEHTPSSSGGCPVTGHGALFHRDWAKAFDHADPVYNANAPEIWKALRESGCPVAHTDAYGGTWLPVTHETVHQIAYDTEHFSSVGVVVNNVRPDWSQAPLGGAAPITSDPPAHHSARRLLLPAFSPKAINPWEGEIRKLCVQLLDEIEADMAARGETSFDAAKQYAQHIPVNVIARMLGMPLSDAELFREFVHIVLEEVDAPAEARMDAIGRVAQYIRDSVEDHRNNPKDDLIGYLVDVRDENGEPLTEEHIVGSVILLLVAGIDTTWSAIGSALWHFGANGADRRRLVEHPELLSTAIEEMLRAYAPVTMARVVREDIEIGGVMMKRDDWTLLPFPAANRDPEQFENPDEVLIDRAENRHSAFGLGIHRCIGSNLARLELTIAVEEFLKRFSEYHVSGDVRWSVGQVRGPRELPVTLG